MRSGFAALAVYVLVMGSAQADLFKIGTAESNITHAVSVLMDEAYRQLGHDTEYEYLPAKRSLWEVNTGKLDAELIRVTGIETEYPNLVRVEEPVLTMQISAVVRSDSKITALSWMGIGDRSVGYPRGYKILDIRTRDLNATHAKDPTTVIKMLLGGRMEIALLLKTDAVALAQEFGGVTVLEPPLEEVALYHYVHVKHRRLVPRLEEVLIEMNDSGRSQEILAGQM